MSHAEPDSVQSPADTSTEEADAGQDLTSEALVEEVSIDGMCGVY